MSIYDLVKENPNVIIQMTAGNVAELVDSAITRAKSEFISEPKEKEDSLISVRKASELLGVNRTTLWRYNKENYLNVIEVGGKRKYKLSDVERILNGK